MEEEESDDQMGEKKGAEGWADDEEDELWVADIELAWKSVADCGQLF